MADLRRMNADQLMQFMKTNANGSNEIWDRFSEMATEFQERNEQLSKTVIGLKPRNQTDEYRIEDLIELRDKINDGFYVLKENEQEYPVPDRVIAAPIAGQILRALERAEDFLADCCREFYQRDEDRIRIEQDDTREMIRFIDRTLADAHIQQMAAFIGLKP